MLKNYGPPSSIADGANDLAQPLHGGRTGRSLRHTQPPGVGPLAVAPTLRAIGARPRRSRGLLPRSAALPERYSHVYSRAIFCRNIMQNTEYIQPKRSL